MLLNKLKNYIDSNELEMHIYMDGIYVINYKLISIFNDKKIKFSNITISGSKLIISRLRKDELFISGNIDSILFNEK